MDSEMFLVFNNWVHKTEWELKGKSEKTDERKNIIYYQLAREKNVLKSWSLWESRESEEKMICFGC